jgi:hypothetical protein
MGDQFMEQVVNKIKTLKTILVKLIQELNNKTLT